MAQIPKETIEAIRDRTDIVEVIGRVVTLKKRGRNLIGLCPFHQEKTPSFNVLPERQIYHCFGCSEGGDVFKFVMKTQGLGFVETVKELAGPAGVTIEERELTEQERTALRRRASLFDACEAAAAWFHKNLMTSPGAVDARTYLEERGITRETATRYRLGYAPPGWDNLANELNRQRIPAELALRASLCKRSERSGGIYDVFRDRLIFPILDTRDRPVAFGGRVMSGDGPKYLNSPESEVYDKSATLYGLSWARPHIQRRGRALLVEGYFDVLALLQAGFRETIATCGTSLTPKHVSQLQRLTSSVVTVFDSDEAGQRAAERSLPLFLDAGIEARKLDLGDDKDPDDFVRERGSQAFEVALKRATPLLENVARRLASRHGRTGAGRAEAVNELVPLLRRMPEALRNTTLPRMADLLDVQEYALREAVGRGRQQASGRPSGEARRTLQPSPEVKRLVWLLVQHTAAVTPVLQQVPPQLVTTHRALGATIGRLLGGEDLGRVLSDTEDQEVVALFTAAAAHAGPHTSETAVPAAMRILARLELRQLQARLSEIKHRTEQASDPGDMRALVLERMELQRRLPELRKRVSRGLPDEG